MGTGACVYIPASRKHGTLYVGTTSNLAARIHAHRQGSGSAFARKYGTSILVHAEFHESMPAAIMREKQIKKWNRAWKVQLIERDNPEWDDLMESI